MSIKRLARVSFLEMELANGGQNAAMDLIGIFPVNIVFHLEKLQFHLKTIATVEEGRLKDVNMYVLGLMSMKKNPTRMEENWSQKLTSSSSLIVVHVLIYNHVSKMR